MGAPSQGTIADPARSPIPWPFLAIDVFRLPSAPRSSGPVPGQAYFMVGLVGQTTLATIKEVSF
jgi:hypothetical protein